MLGADRGLSLTLGRPLLAQGPRRSQQPLPPPTPARPAPLLPAGLDLPGTSYTVRLTTEPACATLQVIRCRAHSPEMVAWLLLVYQEEVRLEVWAAGRVTTCVGRGPASQVTVTGSGK